MSFFKDYIYFKRKTFLIYLLFVTLLGFSFWLYLLPIMAILYPALLFLLFSLFVLIIDYQKSLNKHKRLLELRTQSAELIEHFPEPHVLEDIDYSAIIEALCKESRIATNTFQDRYAEMSDYYTLWAHQIKTPIAAMRLHLQNDSSDNARVLLDQLFRIEQYVEMVLCFLRVDSTGTDFVFAEYELDAIISRAIRKYASMFIRKKIRLEYIEVDERVITDEKWLGFVIEQILSNALKYTESGTIYITLSNQFVLCIKDTGIGIDPSDLPRIFEKSFTGYNGRKDMKSSGIGLYLSGKTLKKLGHDIRIESAIDAGTSVFIDLSRNNKRFE